MQIGDLVKISNSSALCTNCQGMATLLGAINLETNIEYARDFIRSGRLGVVRNIYTTSSNHTFVLIYSSITNKTYIMNKNGLEVHCSKPIEKKCVDTFYDDDYGNYNSIW